MSIPSIVAFLGVLSSLLLSCSTIDETVNDQSWCLSLPLETSSPEWGNVDTISLVDRRYIEGVLIRLRRQSVVQISSEEAEKLSGEAINISSGMNYYIARAGTLNAKGLPYDAVYETASKYQRINALWNRGKRSIWVGTFQLGRGHLVPYNLALVVGIPGKVETGYVACHAAE